MKRTGCLVMLLLLLLAAAAAADERTRPDKVVLIGWDGAQRQHVKESLARGQLPNLETLRNEGRLVAIDILRTTDTKAGWAQILTGYNPEITGVFRNTEFGPIPAGYTVFERLEKFFGPDKFQTAALIAKAGNLGTRPPKRLELDEVKVLRKKGQGRRLRGGRIVEENGREYFLIPAEPYYLTRQQVDVFENGLGRDEAVVDRVLTMLEDFRQKPFFIFVHLAEIDRMGHAHGENSAQYDAALAACDQLTGRIVARLKALGLYARTLVYVTADHGFDEGRNRHADAPYVFLATNDPAVMRRGERADIAATILERFGLDLSAIDPPLSGHSLTKPLNLPLW